MESTEYKSKLISELYNAQNEVVIGEILEEMKDISDDIFLGAIYDSFIKNKEKDPYVYIDALRYFKGEPRIDYAFKILKELSLDYTFEISCLYDIFEEELYSHPDITQIGYTLVKRVLDGKENYYFTRGVIDYFKKIKQTTIIKELLFGMITKENSTLDEDEKINALGAWIESDKENNFNLLLETSFSELGTNFDIVLARFILNWNGPKIEKLRLKINESGSIRSKEILKRSDEKKKLRDEIKLKKDEDTKISTFKEKNANLIREIIDLRKSIDTIFLINYGKKIFKAQEELALEIFSPSDESEFQTSCLRLRDLFEGIESFSGNHNLTLSEQKVLLPDTNELHLNKGINALFLFLNSKGYTSDGTIFGGRNFHKICTLAGSHIRENKPELIKKLKEVGLEKLFISNDWGNLQFSLLNLYREYLSKFRQTIE